MPCGCVMICKKCNINYHLFFGGGKLSATNNLKGVLYLCPECGIWGNKLVHISNELALLRNEDGYENEDSSKKCPRCNIYMVHYENYNPIMFKKMICPDCKSVLVDSGLLIFD